MVSTLFDVKKDMLRLPYAQVIDILDTELTEKYGNMPPTELIAAQCQPMCRNVRASMFERITHLL